MYGLIGWNQDKPGVIVFLLASTIWGQGHAAYSLVGARPRGPDTNIYYAEMIKIQGHDIGRNKIVGVRLNTKKSEALRHNTILVTVINRH